MKNIFLNDPNLVFKVNKSSLSKEEILKEIFTFEGKKDFLNFYLLYNGIVFPNSAFLYRDSFYEVSDTDYNRLDIGCFFEFSNSNNSILKIWKSMKQNPYTIEFSSKYLPFGNDSSGNLYCIEYKTGIIIYLQHESTENKTLVAPSFIEFCNKITSKIR